MIIDITKKWKHRKNTLYKILNISINKAPIGKHRYGFLEKPCMYVYQKEKNEVSSIVSELNKKKYEKRELCPKRLNKAPWC